MLGTLGIEAALELSALFAGWGTGLVEVAAPLRPRPRLFSNS